jgi:acyl-CoA thioester hydrolase
MNPAENPASVNRFDRHFLVGDADIDANGHANNVAYLRWVQDAAVAHWSTVVERESPMDLSWVVVRHEIDYEKPAYRGDALIARTWLGKITAATTERFCEILRPADGQLLARSRTIWCAIDARTGRPRRIDARIKAYLLGHSPAVQERPGR